METGDLVQAVVWFTVRVNGKDFVIEKDEQLVVLGVENVDPEHISKVLTRFGLVWVHTRNLG